MSQHTLTVADLTEGETGDTYYTGPLEPAQEFLRESATVTESQSGDHFLVFIGQDGQDISTWEDCNEWGSGVTLEEAWRYAAGAAFGPADDEFVPFVIGSRTWEPVPGAATVEYRDVL